MKILVICQHYYPEPFRITDICEELVRRGNEVTVVTGIPNYPMGEIYPGYEDGKRADEIINGVRVHRCNIHPRKTGALHRLWNYYSYPRKSKKYIKSLDGSFDVVFINQLSPVMMAKAGICYAKKHKKKSVLYCLDLWPASLSAGGLSGGPVYKWFHRESRRIYKSVDKILVSSRSFAEYFEAEFGIKETTYLPQYSENLFSPSECKKTPDEYIDLMFAGNVGVAQSVSTVIRAAKLTEDIENLRWHIVGDGIDLDNCRKLAEELSLRSVIFHGRRKLEEMPKYYAMADAMLVTMQRDPIISLTLPGKVQSYMAAGKAIIGAIDKETADVISDSGAGVVSPAEDYVSLAENVRRLAASPELFTEYGAKSLAYSEQNFAEGIFFDRLIGELDTAK
jgi:glycosyltransferase involved in cell wall biosynthesis